MPNADPPSEKPARRMSGQETAEHIIEQAARLRDLSAVIGAFELRELFERAISRTRQLIEENNSPRTPPEADDGPRP